jgi:hypothetical protein
VLLRHGWLALLMPVVLLACWYALSLERRRRERLCGGLVFEEAPVDAFQTLSIFD